MVSTLALLTAVHTALSIVGIAAGLLATAALCGKRLRYNWMPTFLILAWTTTLTGYLFPFNGLTPAIVTGFVAIAVLALLHLSQSRFNLKGRWRAAYAASVVASVYLLVFVAIVQAFLKIPTLHALAPNGNEAPFAITQGAALIAFIALGIITVRKFKPAAPRKRR